MRENLKKTKLIISSRKKTKKKKKTQNPTTMEIKIKSLKKTKYRNFWISM